MFAHKKSSYNISDIREDIIEINDLKLNFSNLTFPMTNKQLHNFEKNNTSLSLNVYIKNGVPDLIYKSNNLYGPNKVDLLFKKTSKNHYVVIQNIESFLNKGILDYSKKMNDPIMYLNQDFCNPSPPLVVYVNIRCKNDEFEKYPACVSYFIKTQDENLTKTYNFSGMYFL